MVVVGAVMVQHMQRDPGVLGESLEEFAHQFGVEGADLLGREGQVADQVGTGTETNGRDEVSDPRTAGRRPSCR